MIGTYIIIDGTGREIGRELAQSQERAARLFIDGWERETPGEESPRRFSGNETSVGGFEAVRYLRDGRVSVNVRPFYVYCVCREISGAALLALRWPLYGTSGESLRWEGDDWFMPSEAGYKLLTAARERDEQDARKGAMARTIIGQIYGVSS